MYLALDVGGSTGRVEIYEYLYDQKPLGRREIAVSQHLPSKPGDFEADYANLLAACRDLRDTFTTVDGIKGIGLAVAGKANQDRSGLLMAGNVAHWVNQPVRFRLEFDFGCPVALGNDAEAAALAEAVYGLGPNQQDVDFIGMIWGTGVGGACVRCGPKGQRMTTPMEPGHIVIGNDTGVKCRGCDDHGHLEAYCGGGNLPNHFGGKTGAQLDQQDWSVVIDWMTSGLKNILLVQPVNLVTFSGGVACKHLDLLEQLQHNLDQERYGRPTIQVSKFGESAGTLGALSLLTLDE